ncbi:MAG: hypothetical protein OEV42_16625 [Deltaproteobacteria bacterium]|nr:hypothetical protein [Deltaproteobacteria bacterium]
MKGISLLLSAILILAVTSISQARPETIKPGLSYFAEDYETKNNISEITVEKNFEEVFKNYEYFESVYDEKKRVKIFRAYKRGDVILTEHYHYDSRGKLREKKIEKEGKPAESITY